MHALRKCVDDPTFGKRDSEMMLRDMLLELGTPDHLIGYEYLVKAILMAAEDRKWIDNITFGLYPQLAFIFNSTPSRIERAIRNAIEKTWDRGDYDTLNRYFGNTVSPDKGKPTNCEFIARLANILRMRLKAA